MILIIIFASIALLPFIIAGGVYVVKYVRYLMNSNRAPKIKKQAIVNYTEFRRTLSEELLKNEKTAAKRTSLHYTTPLDSDYCIIKPIADRFGVGCEMNWYSTNCRIESEDDYVDRKLKEARIDKPTNFFGDEDSDAKSGLIVAAWGIGGLGLLITGSIAGISHTSNIVKKREMEISENYCELKQNKITLEKNKEQFQQIEWNKLVLSHNEKTKTFYIDIQKHQINANNPWLNWFVNPAWSKFDITEIKQNCTITFTEVK